MKSIWDKVINLGISEELASSEKSKIRLINRLSVIAALGGLVIFFGSLFLFPETFFWTEIFVVLFPILFLYFNHSRKYIISKLFICAVYPSAISFQICMDGATSGEFTLFLLFGLLGYVLYEKDKKTIGLLLLWNGLNSVCSYLFVIYSFKENIICTNVLGTIIVSQLSIIVAAYIISFYQKEIADQRNYNEKMMEDLQRKSLELERFAFISSHDLKVPLKNIIGFSELISSSIKEDNLQSANDYCKIIHTNARRMDNLIEDTLEIISYDKRHAEFESIDLNKVIDQVELLISNSYSQRNYSIQMHSTLPVIKGVKSELLSCFKNLIENSIKYNHGDPLIEIDCSSIGDYHYITFKDNGIGIPAHKVDEVFDMYVRLVRNDDYEGSGLGLPICKKIIEKMGGSIWVESKEGEGSTFYLKFLKALEKAKQN